eukprot:10846-Amphidinium_carterae.1
MRLLFRVGVEQLHCGRFAFHLWPRLCCCCCCCCCCVCVKVVALVLLSSLRCCLNWRLPAGYQCFRDALYLPTGVRQAGWSEFDLNGREHRSVVSPYAVFVLPCLLFPTQMTCSNLWFQPFQLYHLTLRGLLGRGVGAFPSCQRHEHIAVRHC